jgi:hypothetical protein
MKLNDAQGQELCLVAVQAWVNHRVRESADFADLLSDEDVLDLAYAAFVMGWQARGMLEGDQVREQVRN